MSIGIGVIGAGLMGADHARIAAGLLGGARLVAVSDPDADRAAAASFGAAILADPLDLIRAPSVDAVIIASPDATHAEYVLACIKAGKPVLCEKPLAPTPQDCRRIVDAEIAGGRRLVQTGFMRRFDAGYREMKAALQSGKLGPARLLHNVHRNARVPDWFTGPMAITNSFPHEIDITRWLLDEEPVSAQVHAGPGGDPLLIVMTTASGILVFTEVTMNAVFGYHVHAELTGSLGGIAMAAPTRTLTSLAGAASHPYAQDWRPRFADAYHAQDQAWIDAIAQGRNAGASAWDGYVCASIAACIAEALNSGETVSLPREDRPAFYD